MIQMSIYTSHMLPHWHCRLDELLILISKASADALVGLQGPCAQGYNRTCITILVRY